MSTFGPPRATCTVFTFKEGLLSAVAHDLELAVDRFEVTVDEATQAVRATFDARSVRVVAAVVNGAPSPSTLSAKDRATIEGNIDKDVLHAGAHPTITFAGTLRGDAVEGTLQLHGVSRPLRASVAREAGHATVEVGLHQPDYGIKPYSAMLGTLKIKPDVRVRLRVPV